MATEQEIELQVSFRGKSLSLASVDRNTRLYAIKERLEELTSVPVSNQKLIFKGKALYEDLDTLGDVGVFQAGASSQKPRLMLVGSTTSEVQVALGPPGCERAFRVRNDLDGVVIPKGYKRVSLNYGAAPPSNSPFRFVQIKTLPLPEEDKAREILESLASDPGIRTVLEKHRWTVGALCELYPEGKVGVSPKVVLGLNENHGRRILLRLRTDDLKGFRKILSIRKTLFHELAHNDISDHNDDFYALMRQVEKEAADFDLTQKSGRSLRGGTAYDDPTLAPSTEAGYILVKEAFEGGSSRLGGDSENLSKMFTAGELAARAAILRLTPEEQEVEDCCGHTPGNESLLHAAIAAATPATPSSAAANGAEVAVLPGTPRAHEGKTGAPRDPGAVGVEHQGGDRSAPMDVIDVSSVPISDSGAREEAQGKGALVPDVDLGMDGVIGEAREEEGPGGGRASPEVAAGEGASRASLADESGVRGGGDVASRPGEAEGVNTDEEVDLDKMDVESATPLPVSAMGHPLQELVAMGFPRDKAAAALAATGGSIPDAASRLVSASSERTQDEIAAGGEATLRLARDVRLQQAAARVAQHHDPAAAARCADTLIGVFRNIMEHPDDEKFRRIRRSNAKFKAAVASVPGGVDVLLAAGFEERGSDQLELGRRDPGLLWLARSTVEANREQLHIGR